MRSMMRVARNYLRVRGEYKFGSMRVMEFTELPPRARRIRSKGFSHPMRVGTTSACAENTGPWTRTIHTARNYLRVRGEYFKPSRLIWHEEELPPRARRIPNQACRVQRVRGTTSACAENTCLFPALSVSQRNYLRVRGEYPWGERNPGCCTELPPRARRIPNPRRHNPYPCGTTSACAENTLNELGLL